MALPGKHLQPISRYSRRRKKPLGRAVPAAREVMSRFVLNRMKARIAVFDVINWSPHFSDIARAPRKWLLHPRFPRG